MNFIKKNAKILALVLSLFLNSNNSYAEVLIDDFTGDLLITASIPSNQNPVYGGSAFAGAIGGFRAYKAEVTGGLDIRLRTIQGRLSHSADDLTFGKTMITWDGDVNPINLNATGLGARNLMPNGEQGIRLGILGCDQTCKENVMITFTVYSSATNFSKATVPLLSIFPNNQIAVAFNSFTIAGGTGANFANVGAISMEIVDQGEYAVDISLDFIHTGCISMVCPTATPTPSNTPTRTNTATRTYTPSATATRTFTPSNTATRTATATSTRTNTFTSTATRTFTPSVTRTYTPSPTRTITPSITPTLTATRTNTFTSTATRTYTPSVTQTFTPSATRTNTATSTVTRTYTPIITATYTPSATRTSSPTNTFTPSATRTNTPTSTASRTFTPTITATFTPSVTRTNTFTPTATSTSTRTFTPSVTATSTATRTSTATNTATNTATSTATSTNTFTPTFTATVSNTPTITATFTPGICKEGEVVGDADLDCCVTAKDLAIWKANYGLTGATVRNGDFNKDGIVDGADFTLWQDNLNENCNPPTPTPLVTPTIASTVTVGVTPTVINVTCEPVDNTQRRIELDQAAKKQERVIIDAIRVAKKVLQKKTDPEGQKLLTNAQKILSTAHAIQLDNWRLSWIGPTNDNNCPDAQACATYVYTEVKGQYSSQALQLRKLFNDAIKIRRQTRKLYGATVLGDVSRDKKLTVKAEAEYQNAIKQINLVPDSSKDC